MSRKPTLNVRASGHLFRADRQAGNVQKGNAATQAKKRWGAANYKVVKVSVNPGVALAFKEACAAANVSMAGKLSQFMAEYSKAAVKPKPKLDYSTRRKRRVAVIMMARQLEQVMAAEGQCRDNTPENLQGSIVYEQADEYVSLLEEAIEQLRAIY